MIVFFLRRHNDIDHMAPVIYQAAKDRDVSVWAIALDPAYDMTGDARIQYLRKHTSVRFAYFYEIFQPGRGYKLMARLLGMCSAKTGLFRGSLNRLLKTAFYPWIYERAAKKYFYHKLWAIEWLKRAPVKALVFDYAKTHQHLTGVFCEAARASRIPTIAIPHGLKLWGEESVGRKGYVNSGFQETLPYDYFVVANDIARWSYEKAGMPKDKIAVLGSARYCPEGREICSQIYPEYRGPVKKDNGLKVVFFEGGERFLVSREGLTALLQSIARLDFVTLVVQPRPRNSYMDFSGLPSSVIVDRETPAFRLTGWADAVVAGVTSVFIEPLLTGKPLFFPKYLFSLKTVLEEFSVGCTVGSSEELVDALKRMRDHRFGSPYSDESRLRLLDALVFNNAGNGSVLEKYGDFILQIAGYEKAAAL